MGVFRLHPIPRTRLEKPCVNATATGITSPFVTVTSSHCSTSGCTSLLMQHGDAGIATTSRNHSNNNDQNNQAKSGYAGRNSDDTKRRAWEQRARGGD